MGGVREQQILMVIGRELVRATHHDAYDLGSSLGSCDLAEGNGINDLYS